jgi:hypothetical protein
LLAEIILSRFITHAETHLVPFLFT